MQCVHVRLSVCGYMCAFVCLRLCVCVVDTVNVDADHQTIRPSLHSLARMESHAGHADTANAASAANAAPRPLMMQVVEMDTGITATFRGLCDNRTKRLFAHVLPSILTVGLWYLLNAWFLGLRVLTTMSECPIAEADWILGTNDEGTADLREVQTTALEDGQPVRYFTYRYVRFVFSGAEGRYVICNVADMIRRDAPRGLDNSAVCDRRALVGENGYDIETKPWYLVLADGVLHLFNVFQLFAAGIWWSQNQWQYAVAILVLSVYSVVQTLVETLRSFGHLKEMAYFSCPVHVLRDGMWRQAVSSEELVPGDVFELDCDMEILPCDALLISGEVLLNESMLTGESIPVVRKSIPANEPLARHLDNKASLLYAGTRLMRIRGGSSRKALAIAIRTGYDTYKGFLIRQIMFPPPLKFKFYEDSIKFVVFLCCLAVGGIVYTIVLSLRYGLTLLEAFVACADLVTVIVPPALPAVLTVGVTLAIGRLKRAHITTTFAAKLNICGRLDVFCFDKTGTLTEEGLDICAVVGTRNREREMACDACDDESTGDEESVEVGLCSISGEGDRGKERDRDRERDNDRGYDYGQDRGCDDSCDEDETTQERVFAEPVCDAADLSVKFFHLLSCCHTVTYVHGRLVGDPLDLKMFEFTGCVLEEPDHSPDDTNLAGTIVRPFEGSGNELKIIRSFPFEASLKRQSVLIRDVIEESYEFYTKGAPEVIKDHCRATSLPEDFDDLLGHYARHGQRVVACAYKRMPEEVDALMRLPRGEIESDLNFLGFIVFENRLKEESPVAIRTLAAAQIRSVMVTGDNVLTAINVARKCGIVSEECKVFFPVGDVVGPEGAVKFVNVEDAGEWLTDLPSFLLHHQHARPAKTRKFQPEVQLALTGRVFSQLKEQYSWPVFSALLARCNIYARMSPLEKHELVEELQELDHCVAMVGDGANDCGALRVADVGVSLSETEASLAAPFCSSVPTIACAPRLVREGRAALVTSFASFKYMTLYSVIQSTTCLMLRYYNGTLSSYEFIAFDMVTVLALSTLLANTGPHDVLDRHRPTASLISAPVISSIACQTAVQVLFQCFARFGLQHPAVAGKTLNEADRVFQDNYFKSILFPLSAYQYIWMALVYGIGGRYRSPMYSNRLLVLYTALLFVAYTLLLFTDIDAVRGVFGLSEESFVVELYRGLLPMDPPVGAMRLYIFLLALLNFAASLFCELVLVPMCVAVVGAVKRVLPRRLTHREELEAFSIEDLEKSDPPTRRHLHKRPLLKKL